MSRAMEEAKNRLKSRGRTRVKSLNEDKDDVVIVANVDTKRMRLIRSD
jgi:hypothetical protein